MAGIVTVAGEIAPQELGFCQCHEHLLLCRGKSCELHPALLMDSLPKSTREAALYRAAGGRSIVDAQPLGCCRMSAELSALSHASGVQLVASTGFHKLAFYPSGHWIFSITRESFFALLMQELQNGMYADGDWHFPMKKTPFRAGLIKTALDAAMLSPRYLTLFEAASQAAKETGAPLMIHVEKQADPRVLLDFLKQQGLPAKQLIFCHMDRACPSLTWHLEIAASGAFLEYDTIGRFKYHSDEAEAAIIRQMIDAGYAGQLLLSLDTTRERLGSYGGHIDLCYLLKVFLPYLQKNGVPPQFLHQIMVENSARALTWNAPAHERRSSS